MVLQAQGGRKPFSLNTGKLCNVSVHAFQVVIAAVTFVIDWHLDLFAFADR